MISQNFLKFGNYFLRMGVLSVKLSSRNKNTSKFHKCDGWPSLKCPFLNTLSNYSSWSCPRQHPRQHPRCISANFLMFTEMHSTYSRRLLMNPHHVLIWYRNVYVHQHEDTFMSRDIPRIRHPWFQIQPTRI